MNEIPNGPPAAAQMVERCYGGASVPMLAARESLIFPPDLLDWFLATQRPSPGTDRHPVAASAGSSGAVSAAPESMPQVVRLDDFRRGG